MLTSTVSRAGAHAIHRGKAPHITVPNKEQVWAAFMEKKRATAIKYSQEPEHNSQAKSQFSLWQARDSWPSSQQAPGKQKLPAFEDLHPGSGKATNPVLSLLLNILPNCLSMACLCPHMISWGFRTIGLNNVYLKRIRSEAVTCQGPESPKINTLNWPFIPYRPIMRGEFQSWAYSSQLCRGLFNNSYMIMFIRKHIHNIKFTILKCTIQWQ